jgi:hypothetical protein
MVLSFSIVPSKSLLLAPVTKMEASGYLDDKKFRLLEVLPFPALCRPSRNSLAQF